MAELPKRIHLINSAEGRFEEGQAAAAITPGMLVALNVDGEYVPHPTAAGFAEKNFALEDALQGRTIDTDYADGERVFTVIANPGDVIYALLAPGESVDQTDFLTSNGDGMLKAGTGTNAPVGVPLEAVDNSDTDSGTEPKRIRVRIL